MVMMAASSFTPSCIFILGRRINFESELKLPFAPIAARQRLLRIAAKAVGDGSDSSSQGIVKYVQNAWDSSENRIAFAGLGFAAIVAVWASVNLITAIDKLPVIPGVLEFIGMLFSWWFIYRYLLFKPDREELSKIIKNYLSDILGQ